MNRPPVTSQAFFDSDKPEFWLNTDNSACLNALSLAKNARASGHFLIQILPVPPLVLRRLRLNALSLAKNARASGHFLIQMDAIIPFMPTEEWVLMPCPWQRTPGQAGIF